MVPFSKERKYFGISYPEKPGSIIYKAATAELEIRDLSKHSLEKFVFKNGKYIFIPVQEEVVTDFLDKIKYKIKKYNKKIVQNVHFCKSGAIVS